MTGAIPYNLVRSRRKTIAIHITKDAAVEVRAPLKMPERDIGRFVASKERWISRQVEARERLNLEKNAFTIDYGDSATLCGKPFPILARDVESAGFDGECFCLPPCLTPDGVKREIVKVYRALSLKILTARVDVFAKHMGVTPRAVKISGAGTRWGSCSAKNSLSFSWRLVMADEDVIDYVVVHELAHIREHNHSPRFWALVEKAVPDCGERRRRLKLLSQKLASEAWD